MSTKRDKSFYCPLPWNHLSIEPSGKVYTCCNAKVDDFLGELKDQSIDEILHGDSLSLLRDQFRKNQIPKQCETCVFQEENGQVSLREASIGQFPEVNQESDPSISFLGVRFGNTCNMSCRICSSGLSTSWYEDDKALGNKIPNGRVFSFSSERYEELIKLSGKSLAHLYFAGGEPFLQPEFHTYIMELVRGGFLEKSIMINTNGSVLGNPQTLENLKKFNEVNIELSLDDFGKRAEYSRKGSLWSVIEKNISTLRESRFNIFVTPTVSLLNIYYLDEILRYFIKKLDVSPRSIRLTVLRSPEYYCVTNLPAPLKEKVNSKLKLFSKELLSNYDLGDVEGLLCEISAVCSAMQKEPQSNMSRFLEEIEKIDQVRGEDFFTVFNEFSSELTGLGI